MGCHGMPWDAMELDKKLKIGIPWDAMECNGMPQNTTECHIMPWNYSQYLSQLTTDVILLEHSVRDLFLFCRKAIPLFKIDALQWYCSPRVLCERFSIHVEYFSSEQGDLSNGGFGWIVTLFSIWIGSLQTSRMLILGFVSCKPFLSPLCLQILACL